MQTFRKLITNAAKSTLEFLTQLRTNNNKTWFDAHRQEYQNARADFANFVDNIITEVSKKTMLLQHLKSKDCMFRINRTFGSQRIKNRIKPISCFPPPVAKIATCRVLFSFGTGRLVLQEAACGCRLPSHRAKVRQEIDYNLSISKNHQNKTFKEIYGELTAENGQKLTRVPKGYEADNLAAEYLKFKSFVVMKGISDAELTSKTWLKIF